MKISELIKEIVDVAESKFDAQSRQYNGHVNDCISVWIYYVSILDMWQVGLERPSKEQLECGEIENWETVKSCVNRVAFYSEANSLLEALYILQDKINDADDMEFDA